MLDGLGRFPVDTPVDATVAAARRQRRRPPTPARCSTRSSRRSPVASSSPPAPPRLAERPPTAIFVAQVPAAQLPRVVPVHRAAHPGARHRRQLRVRGPNARRPEPDLRDDARRRELGPDLRLLPAPSAAGPAPRADPRGLVRRSTAAFARRRLRLRRPGRRAATTRRRRPADPSLLVTLRGAHPALATGTTRPLFAAVQFPVLVDDPACPARRRPRQLRPGVHRGGRLRRRLRQDRARRAARQPEPAREEPDGFPPLTDIGIRLGWDDEQILIWQNRQLKADPTVPRSAASRNGSTLRIGAFGYRIDARRHGEANWHSLVQVRSKAPLTLDGIALGDPPDAPFDGRARRRGPSAAVRRRPGPATISGCPAYLAQWNGTSPVLPDETPPTLFQTEEAHGDGRQPRPHLRRRRARRHPVALRPHLRAPGAPERPDRRRPAGDRRAVNEGSPSPGRDGPLRAPRRPRARRGSPTCRRSPTTGRRLLPGDSIEVQSPAARLSERSSSPASTPTRSRCCRPRPTPPSARAASASPTPT